MKSFHSIEDQIEISESNIGLGNNSNETEFKSKTKKNPKNRTKDVHTNFLREVTREVAPNNISEIKEDNPRIRMNDVVKEVEDSNISSNDNLVNNEDLNISDNSEQVNDGYEISCSVM